MANQESNAQWSREIIYRAGESQATKDSGGYTEVHFTVRCLQLMQLNTINNSNSNINI